jgi:membrane-bound lytic murein transglycosylase D
MFMTKRVINSITKFVLTGIMLSLLTSCESKENPKILKMEPKEAFEHQEVQRYVKHFSRCKSLDKTTLKAKPHLEYISEQLDKRNLPRELALLPMIESNFQTQATSHKGAAGLWQFMPQTGRQYGLTQKGSYDPRRDIKASTQAALLYLEYLHQKFDKDWMLALAAYNAGEGTIQRAIKRNRLAGKPTTFWALKIPKETRQYVPKFLALVKVVTEKGGLTTKNRV